MADDDASIQLNVGVGASNSQLDGVNERLEKLFDMLNLIIPELGKVEGVGTEAFRAIGGQLKQLIYEARAPNALQPIIDGLNRGAVSAKQMAAALKELQIRENSSPTAIQRAARSNDPAQLSAALAGNQRTINQLQLSQRAIESVTGELSKAQSRTITQNTKFLEDQLTAAKKREALLVQRLEQLSSQQRVEEQVQRRQRRTNEGAQAQVLWENTPEGKAETAAKLAAEEKRKAAAAYLDDYRSGRLQNTDYDARAREQRTTAKYMNDEFDRKYSAAQARATYDNRNYDMRANQAYGTAAYENRNYDMRYAQSYAQAGYENRDRNLRYDNAFTSARYENQDRTLQYNQAHAQAGYDNRNYDLRYNQSYAQAAYENQNRNLQYNQAHAQAGYENQNRNLQYNNDRTLAGWMNQDYDIRFNSDPKNIAARRVSQAQSSAAVSGVLGNDFQGLSAIAEAQRLSAQLKDQVNQLAGPTPAQQRAANPNNIAAQRLQTTLREVEVLRQQTADEELIQAKRDLAAAKAGLKNAINPGAAPPSYAEQVAQTAKDQDAKSKLNQDVMAYRRAQGTASPVRSQQQVSAEARDRRQEYLTGDGGAFLFETQARLQVQYMALNTVFSGLSEGVRAVVEFDKAMQNLQAVTGATDKQLHGLQDTVLGISRDSVFSAHELAQAAEELAKNGLTLGEINTTLQNASILASATGSSLKESTELLTSALETFKVQNSEAKTVLDQTFFTLNSSRLSVDKLNESLQGAGVTAKESGVSLAEFSATVATLANSGLSSSTQLNQGLRQVLTVLNEPTTKFKAKLDELGISMKDIDIRSNSLVGVFENLRAAGFTSADAFSTLQARVATTFVTLLNSTDAQRAQYAATLQATGAADAQASAMKSLADQVTRLGNTFTALAVHSTGTVKGALTTIVEGLNATATAATSVGSTWNVLTTVLGSLGLAAAGKAVLGLVSNLSFVKTAITDVQRATVVATATLEGFAAVDATATGATLLLGAALKSVWVALGPAVLIAGAITALSLYSSSTNEAAEATDKLKEKEGDLHTALEEKSKTLDKVNEFMSTTIARHASLKDGSVELANQVNEARNQFGNLNVSLYDNIHTFDALIATMRNFRTELRASTGTDLELYIANNKAQADAAGAAVKNKVGDNGAVLLAQRLGLKDLSTPLGDLGGFAPINDPETARRMLAVNFKGNDTGLAAAGAVSNKEGMTQEKLQQTMSDLLKNQSKFDPQQFEVLKSTLVAINADLANQRLATAKAATGVDQLTPLQMSQTQAMKDLENGPLAALAGVLNNTKDIQNTRGGPERKAALAAEQAKANPLLAQLQAHRDSLSPEDQKTFDRTDVGNGFQTLKAQQKELDAAVNEFVTTRTEASLKLARQELEAEFKEQKDKISQTKDPKIRAAAADAARKIAGEIRDNAIAQANATAQDAKKTSGKGEGDAEISQANITSVRIAQDEYRTSIDSLNAEQSRIDGRKAPKDPRRPSPAKVEDYGKELDDQVSLADKQASNSLDDASRPLKTDEAFINAASKTGQFPKAVLDLKRKQLNDAEIQKEIDAINIYGTQLDALREIQMQARKDLEIVNQAIEDLKKKYKIDLNSDGTINWDKSNITSEDQRKEITSAMTQNQSQQSGLTSRISKYGEDINKVQGSLETSTALRDARQQGGSFSVGDAVTGFQAASDDFNSKNGLDASGFTQYTDTLTSLFNTMDTTFATFIQNFVAGNLKGKNAFKDFAESIVTNALKIASEKASSALLGEIFSLAGSALGSMFGGFTGSTSGQMSDLSVVPNTNAYGLGNMNTPGAYNGMVIPKYDGGGIIPGVHIGRDNTLINTAPGEAILNRSAVDLMGVDAINQMNAGALRRGASMPQLPKQREPDLVNVYVVDKNTQPQLGKKDVLAAVGEDVLAGGATRKLIQQVALGQI